MEVVADITSPLYPTRKQTFFFSLLLTSAVALVALATSLALMCGSASKPRPSPVQITPPPHTHLGSDVNARQQREHDASRESARALALIRAEIL